MKRKDFLKTAGTGLAGLTILPLTSCASNLPQTPEQRELNKGEKNAMQVLGIQNSDDMCYLNGYHMSKHMGRRIRERAERYTDEYIQEQGINPENRDEVYQGILRRMLEDADPDENYIVDFHDGLKVLRSKKYSGIYLR